MKNTILKFTALAILFSVFLSCDDFVDVELPSDQLTAPTVFQDRTTANAAMANLYAKLRDSGLTTGSGSGLSNLMGNYADEFVYYGSVAASTPPFYNNSLTATNGTVAALWNDSYSQIYSANAIIEGVYTSTALLQADRDQLIGEALFVRALIHFYLANLYGPVPYIMSTDYETNRHVGRLSTDVVYQNVITDLTLAQNLLPEDYLSSERIRPNKAAVRALLARTYLYHGDWIEASNAASSVLNDSQYTLESDIDAVFLKGSTSTIWQFKPSADGINTAEGGNFVIISAPPSFVAVREELVAAFEPGDLRLTHWLGTVSDGTTTWYFANKYKQQTSTGTSMEYSIMLRLSEQYLIRAEARARQGELIGAKDDLNIIRHAAGLGDTPASSQQEILDAIQRERRVELFTEYGHRFFDLKRNGGLDAALSPVKPGWNTTDALLPLPEVELLLNPSLAPQNTGY
ncbi:SusD family protein [compost metagenome]